MENTKIEWATHTFSAWVGCEKISPACDHCYAENWAKRTGQSHLWKGTRRRTRPENWKGPVKWNRQAERDGTRPRVFCSSLADVFDNQAPDEWRADLFRLIRSTPNLDWLLLTKRIGNATRMIERALIDGHLLTSGSPQWPWPNVWIGSTIANQQELERDVLKLVATSAAVHFISYEPALGPLDFCGLWVPHADARVHENALERVDWVIAGGESGSNARPANLQWFESVRLQCEAAGSRFFMKQLGGARDKRGDIQEFPLTLRVREFPRSAA